LLNLICEHHEPFDESRHCSNLLAQEVVFVEWDLTLLGLNLGGLASEPMRTLANLFKIKFYADILMGSNLLPYAF
jgi:hypothetical protein